MYCIVAVSMHDDDDCVAITVAISMHDDDCVAVSTMTVLPSCFVILCCHQDNDDDMHCVVAVSMMTVLLSVWMMVTVFLSVR